MQDSIADPPPKSKVCRNRQGKSGDRLVAYRKAVLVNRGEGYKWNDGARSRMQSAKKNSASAIIQGEVEAVLFSKYEEGRVIWL